MKRFLLAAALTLPVAGAVPDDRIEQSIQAKLGRRYVWGAEGVKSYDCSGFVWRVFRDAGLLMKRTTARKLFYSLPEASGQERSGLGALVFFNRTAHVGIVRNETEFYHASSSHGTTLDHLGAYWRPRVCGYRIVKTGVRRELPAAE